MAVTALAKRSHASVRALGFGLEIYVIPCAESAVFLEGNIGLTVSGKVGFEQGGV